MPPIAKNSGISPMGAGAGPGAGAGAAAVSSSGNYPIGIGGYNPSMGSSATKPSRFNADSSAGFTSNKTTRPPLAGAGIPQPSGAGTP